MNIRSQYYRLKLETVNLLIKIDKFIDLYLRYCMVHLDISIKIIDNTIWTIIELDQMQQYIVLFHLLLLLSLFLKKDISIHEFHIVHLSSENSIFLYRPNDMNHLSNSAGVLTQ